MGTKIEGLPVEKVVDGDTIKVNLNGKTEGLRLICVDTEESYAGSKPVTKAGKMASEMAKIFFEIGGSVTIEFDTDDPVDVCLKRHRGNFGRLLCYAHKGSINYNLKLIEEGWSPYFVKYGKSRQYHNEFTRGEAIAQANERIIWDPATNAGGNSRDYNSLLPWWHYRALVIDDYRRSAGQVLSIRLDYEQIKEAAEQEDEITVFTDFQGGISRDIGDKALIFSGSIHHKFTLVIDDIQSDVGQDVVRLVLNRYSGKGKGYAFVKGRASLYGDTPQIVIRSINQIFDIL